MRILFISFFFPPRKAIACVRTAALCKALLEAGHQVHVLTSEDRSQSADFADDSLLGGEIPAERLCITRVRSWWHDLHDGPGFRSAKGILGKMRTLWTRVIARSLELAGFDPMVPWAMAARAEVGRDARYDCVLVSAGPFSTLFTGLAAARSMGIPLILDYRDVWNDTPHTWLRCSTRWLERMVLRRAALVVSISPSCLESIVGRVAVPRIVVTNGISEDVIQLAANLPPPEGRGLVYAGAFYPPKRSFEPIAAALATLRSWNNDGQQQVACSYLGPSAAYVQEVADRHRVGDAVQTTGAVSRRESLLAQAGSLCTVVVTSIEKTCCLADRGIVTGKLFEAIALAPRVLVISPIDSDVRALTAQMPHVRQFHGGEVQAIAEWLAEIAAVPPRRPSSECWQSVTWPLLGQRFATAVEAAVAQSPQIRGGVPA